MIENHPCYPCTKAQSLMTSPTGTRRKNVCKLYRGIIEKKCADFVLFVKKPKEN